MFLSFQGHPPSPGPYLFSCLPCSFRVLTSCSCPSPSTGVVLSDHFPDPNCTDVSLPLAQYASSLGQCIHTECSCGCRVKNDVAYMCTSGAQCSKHVASLSPTPATPSLEFMVLGVPGSLALCGSAISGKG